MFTLISYVTDEVTTHGCVCYCTANNGRQRRQARYYWRCYIDWNRYLTICRYITFDDSIFSYFACAVVCDQVYY